MKLLIIYALLLGACLASADDRLIIETIRRIAIEEHLDPNLAVAIAKTESRLNDKAIGRHGELGLFQLKPQFHKVVKGDVRKNIRTAVRYLKVVRGICEPKYKDAWIVCYNVGPNAASLRYPKLFPYYIRVMREMNQLLALE